MGMFIKFECSKCGEYSCNCTYDERRGTKELENFNGVFNSAVKHCQNSINDSNIPHSTKIYLHTILEKLKRGDLPKTD